MEKKYLVANLPIPKNAAIINVEQLIFEDIKNLIEVKEENKVITFSFTEGNISFTYKWNAVAECYEEQNNIAPKLFSYKTMCRRTARKHGILLSMELRGTKVDLPYIDN